MVFLAYQTLEEFNKTGIDNLLVYVAQANTIFIPMFLFALFMVVLLGTYFGTKKFTGQSDFFACATAASFLTSVIATLMTLKEGLISTYTLSICVGITILCVIALFFSRNN